MKMLIKKSLLHQGKTLELDSESETMMLLSQTGEQQGTVSWEQVIDFIRSSVEEARFKQVRNYPRSRLAVQIQYRPFNSRSFQSVTGEIGGGGVFIETGTPSHIGEEIRMELLLPDNSTLPIHATGKVSWVRPRSEHYVFFPGMGVQFTDISEEARVRLVELVTSLARARGVS